MIFDESGQELKGTTGAFNEDGNLVLTCEALGGTVFIVKRNINPHKRHYPRFILNSINPQK